MTPVIQYYAQLLQNDFVMPKIDPITNVFEEADDDVIAEIDKLTHTNSLQYKSKHIKNMSNDDKNKKKSYNIGNATIKRHSHFGSGYKYVKNRHSDDQ